MLVRVRRPEDLPGCELVLAAVHESDGYPSCWPADPSAWLTPPALLGAWVATTGSTMDGHVALVSVSPAAEVSRFFVRPGARNSGVGQALIEAVTAAATGLGLGSKLELEVVEGALPARSLYERLGWQFTGYRTADWTTPAGEHPRLARYRPGGAAPRRPAVSDPPATMDE